MTKNNPNAAWEDPHIEGYYDAKDALAIAKGHGELISQRETELELARQQLTANCSFESLHRRRDRLAEQTAAFLGQLRVRNGLVPALNQGTGANSLFDVLIYKTKAALRYKGGFSTDLVYHNYEEHPDFNVELLATLFRDFYTELTGRSPRDYFDLESQLEALHDKMLALAEEIMEQRATA